MGEKIEEIRCGGFEAILFEIEPFINHEGNLKYKVTLNLAQDDEVEGLHKLLRNKNQSVLNEPLVLNWGEPDDSGFWMWKLTTFDTIDEANRFVNDTIKLIKDVVNKNREILEKSKTERKIIKVFL